MIFKRLNQKHTALLIMLLFSSAAGYSQGTDIGSGKKSRLFIGFNVSPGQSTIMNNGSATITQLESKGKSSLGFAAEAGLMFSDYIGVSTGIGYSSFKSDILLSTYSCLPYDTADAANESYKRSVTGTNIKEIQEISFLKIPLLMNIEVPFGKTFSVFFQPGVYFSLPIKKNYESSGKFTYDGFYPAYNVHITGIPYEGLEKEFPTADEGGLKLKSFITELTVSAGVQYKIQDNIQIGMGLVYEKLLSEISNYSDLKDYKLSSKPNQMRSIMEAGLGATASSIGLRISVRILL